MTKFVAAFFFLLLGQSSFAQLQFGLFGGIANYQGDLNEKLFSQPKAAAGFTVGYRINGRFSVRAGLTFASVRAADSLNDQPDLRARNLSFQTPITEFSVRGEFNTFDLDSKRWSPYLFGGLAVYRFNPFTRDAADNRVYLQPLGTEGQGLPGYEPNSPYTLTQLALPFGGGVRFNLTDQLNLGLEVGLRKLFTDYLDDVSGNYADAAELVAGRGPRSVEFAFRGDEVPGANPTYPEKGTTRGSPKYKDYYYFSGLHLTYTIGEGMGGGRKSGYGCPTVF